VKHHLLGSIGRHALAALLRGRPLLAFDFDGTLAPIVAIPDKARIAAAIATRLHRLSKRRPLAIISGRAASDVRVRLGFEPHFIVGNHGADASVDPLTLERSARALDPTRALLAVRADELRAAGVAVEDKGLSIALHYRLASDRGRAHALIRRVLSSTGPAVRTFSGKLVENVVGAEAPDKASALHALVAQCRADSAFFAGDDVNDEPVFAAAGTGWLTVRVGRDDPGSRARFFLDSQSEMPLLLDEMLRELGD